MLQVTGVSLQFGGRKLFEDVNLKFTKGNCYGVIGANGAGKSTFLRVLSGELEPQKGFVSMDKNERMSVLQQNQNMYDDETVLRTVMMGYKRLVEVMDEKDALYAKPDFTEEDGVRAADLESEFAEMNGYDAEFQAAQLLNALDIPEEMHYSLMSDLDAKQKVRVLLAQALFGDPDVLLLDEPTNNLDIKTTRWLENYLMDFENTIIIVSHNRHFLNKVCTNICDVDFGKINMYVGNYDFWYQSSQLMQKLMRDQNRKREEKIKELQSFVERFSANKSKSKQATARRKLLDKLAVEEMPASSRRYPFVGFTMDREPGKEILTVENLSKTVDGVKVLDNVSFRVNRGDKIAFVGENEIAKTTLFKILMEELEPDEGTFKWGTTITTSYFPLDNSAFFNDCDLNLVDWLGQYTGNTAEESTESFKRSFLGRMLFSGDDVFKPVKVLSGGEKVRCMLSRMMLFGSNVLVLDQPTNHLDLESITAVNNGLIDFKGVVLFSSHDHEFVQTIANRIMEFENGKLIDKMGTYEDYIEFRKQQSAG